METKKTKTEAMTVIKDIRNDSTENKVKYNVNRNRKTYGKYTVRKYGKSDTKSDWKRNRKTTKAAVSDCLRSFTESTAGQEKREGCRDLYADG